MADVPPETAVERGADRPRAGRRRRASAATLPHEHIFILGPRRSQNYGHVWGESYWDEEVRVAEAIAKLQRCRDAAASRRSSTRPRSGSAATSSASSA